MFCEMVAHCTIRRGAVEARERPNRAERIKLAETERMTYGRTWRIKRPYIRDNSDFVSIRLSFQFQ